MSLDHLLVNMVDDSFENDFPTEKVNEMAEKYGYQHPTGFESIKNWIRNLREKITRSD